MRDVDRGDYEEVTRPLCIKSAPEPQRKFTDLTRVNSGGHWWRRSISRADEQDQLGQIDDNLLRLATLRTTVVATHGGLRCSSMVCDPWAAPDLHRVVRESVIRCFAAPHICFARAQGGQLRRVSPSSAAFAFWMCFNQLGELNLCRMIWLDSSISEAGTDGGSCDATRILVPLWRISRTTSTSPATRSVQIRLQ